MAGFARHDHTLEYDEFLSFWQTDRGREGGSPNRAAVLIEPVIGIDSRERQPSLL